MIPFCASAELALRRLGLFQPRCEGPATVCVHNRDSVGLLSITKKRQDCHIPITQQANLTMENLSFVGGFPPKCGDLPVNHDLVSPSANRHAWTLATSRPVPKLKFSRSPPSTAVKGTSPQCGGTLVKWESQAICSLDLSTMGRSSG